MNFRLLSAVLLAAIPVAWYAGYLAGTSLQSEDSERVASESFEAQELAVEQYDLDVEASSDTESGGGAILTRANDDHNEAAVANEDEVDSSAQSSGLALAGEMLAAGADKSHLRERQNFEQSFSEGDEDWQAKTNFTDYLQLHEQAHLITLHKILCSTERCQLIGQFDAEHKQWEQVIQGMKEQDWWIYTGTSSSSSTRDGVTYFNLFVDKAKGKTD